MSRRNSGYERKKNELYETPEWVTRALLPHLPKRVANVWEPACGGMKIVSVLRDAGMHPCGTDVQIDGYDFTKLQRADGFDAIITNPPFNMAQEFIEHSLSLMWPAGVVAMLLSVDFDSASTRKHLFNDHPAFCKTVVLTKRIKWFEGPVKCKHCHGTGFDFTAGKKCKPCSGKGEKNQGPSENHAWFVWDWQHSGPSTKAYGP